MAASKGQSLLTTGVWEPWLSPSPSVGLHEEDVGSRRRQGGGFLTCLPDPSSDEQLTPFTFLGGQELALAVLCFAIRSIACISLLRILTAFPRLTLQLRSLDAPRGRFA